MSKKDFSLYPSVKFNRTQFDLSHGVKTSMSVGKLYPIDLQEVLPGDTFKNETSVVARVTSSFIKPVMDNCFMDVYHFFIPLRLCFDSAERVFGNPNPSAYSDNELASLPVTTRDSTVTSGTVADYLGLPVGFVPKGINIAPFRAFALVYDQWFRNQNVTQEMFVQKGDWSLSSESLDNLPWAPNHYTGQLPFVAKKKDYFTSCLPATQKGAPVSTSLTGLAPVVTGDVHSFVTSSSSPLSFISSSGSLGVYNDLYLNAGGQLNVRSGSTSVSTGTVAPSNLYADLGSANSVSVNDLRLAFQLQKMLERDALYGSRYNEYLLGHYGVSSPDSRLQFTEFLGGSRIPINVQQVPQTSASSESSPLGNVGAFSLSNGNSHYNKGFVEHGYVLTVACIRTLHTYQQGIPKLFMRESRNDFYDPLFANLGEQPVYKSELMVSGGVSLKGSIFGYNEAWAEYRYAPSRISGQMRSTAPNSLDIWHFGDYYNGRPTLNSGFIEETATNIDRTLSVPSSSIDNFIVDLWFNTSAIRVLPLYSVPGLIDHH